MKFWRSLVALVVTRRRRALPPPRRRGDDQAPPPTGRRAGADDRAELLTAGLLFGASALALVFVLLYVVWPDTQALGGALGLSLGCLAAAAVIAGRSVVPQETAVEERPGLADEHEQALATQEIASATEGISRRRLLAGGAGAAGLSLAAGLAVPAASLGPDVGGRIDHTPWAAGKPVVDEHGAPITADDITPGAFVTGYPGGADIRELGSPIVLVRLEPSRLRLPGGRRPQEWAPEGIVAYSKVCTHAGCAISLYRYPLYRPGNPRPALVCPCHYSTFDPARGAQVIFGPAGRPLPQLPLRIEAATRRLLAGGGFSGSIGPAWWSVKRG